MSLTEGFIATLPSKPKRQVFGIGVTPGYISPRLQVTSLHENPAITQLKSLLGGTVDVPMVGTQGVKWLTISDGIHSITAVLDLRFNKLVEKGQLKKNSMIFLQAYVVLDNREEASIGRTALINIGELQVIRSKGVPTCIGEPVNIFDAQAPPPTAPSPHRQLLTLGAIHAIEGGTPSNIYTAGCEVNLEVASIIKMNNDTWHLTLFDGEQSIKAAMNKTIELGNLGIQDHLPNNLSTVMSDADPLKVNDIISIPQYVLMNGEKGKVMMCLYNTSIVHKA